MSGTCFSQDGHENLCSTLYESSSGEPHSALGRVFRALARLRTEVEDEESLQVELVRELGEAAGFDRVLASQVSGSMWLPQVLYEAGATAPSVLGDYLCGLEIPLNVSPLEANVVRRRVSVLVSDTGTEADCGSYGPLIRLSKTTCYVVAPLIVAGAVVGLVHADAEKSGRALTVADRDLVRIFADAIGLIRERMLLDQKMRRYRDRIDHALGSSLAAIDGVTRFPTVLGEHLPMTEVLTDSVAERGPCREWERPIGAQVGQSSRGSSVGNLTNREMDVVQLLSEGASNSEIAVRLTVSESTVKSHVKNVLRKLGATNRAGATARYMRMVRASGRSL